MVLNLLLKHLLDFVSLTQDNDKGCQSVELWLESLYHTSKFIYIAPFASHNVPIMFKMTFLPDL